MNRSKKCFKCGVEKPISEFYKHPMMGDGHLNKCKECTKADVHANRLAKLDYYRAYDVRRSKWPNRLSRIAAYTAKRNKRFPKARWAATCVNNAIRDGRLKRGDACEVCGSRKRLRAHHDDYDKPLNVRWLCAVCHSAWHQQNGHGLNIETTK